MTFLTSPPQQKQGWSSLFLIFFKKMTFSSAKAKVVVTFFVFFQKNDVFHLTTTAKAGEIITFLGFLQKSYGFQPPALTWVRATVTFS